MVNRDRLPMDAPNSELSEHCDTGVGVLLTLYREITEHKLTEVYQVENMIQDMITELEEIKEGE